MHGQGVPLHQTWVVISDTMYNTDIKSIHFLPTSLQRGPRNSETKYTHDLTPIHVRSHHPKERSTGHPSPGGKNGPGFRLIQSTPRFHRSSPTDDPAI